MVTEMDRAAERLIVDRLLTARPDDGLIGEEGADHSGTSGIEWVVDPIDGTTNYLYRFPGFAVSIAARTEAGALVGVRPRSPPPRRVQRPSRRRIRRNGERLAVSTQTRLDHALVATGFCYDPDAPGPPGRRAASDRPARSATSGAWARPRSTSARSPAVGSTRTTRRASSPGITPLGALVAAEAGARSATSTAVRSTATSAWRPLRRCSSRCASSLADLGAGDV